jgi:plasmid stabilization system protein ParE
VLGLKLVLHQRAVKDVQEIHDYLLSKAGSEAADRVRAHLRRRMCALLGSYSYRVYYALMRDTVIILHIRPTARRDPDLSTLG